VPGAAIGWPSGLGGCALLLGCYLAAWRLALRVRTRLTSASGGSTPLCRTGLDKIGLV
jgi:hypothetical protein